MVKRQLKRQDARVPTMKIEAVFMVFVAALPLAALPGAAAAGENTIYVLQDSGTGTGNTLIVDQSLANDSVVRGFGSPLSPATQSGDDNFADLSIEGTGGVIQLLQDNAAVGLPGNAATITVDGDALALVRQEGAGNLATVDVSGELAQGGVLQAGSLNDARLTVAGSGATGSITQVGDNNETVLEVLGSGTVVDYTLNGSDLTNAQAGGLQVFTNGAIVTITQSTIVPISR